MSLNLLKPRYFKAPISSVRALSAALGVHESLLEQLAQRASGMYRRVHIPDSDRIVWNASPELKRVQERIKTSLLQRVNFPPYLTGSLKGCDYKTNAEIHAGQQIIICEDVKGFFPSVTSDKVADVWGEFFGFAPEVTVLLTALTTKDGRLPQGAKTSSYLANLVLWRKEPLLEAKLRASGLRYSRYVDDIAVSASRHLTTDDQSSVIAKIYGMLMSEGLRAGRNKHEVHSASRPMKVTKLIVNAKPSLSKAVRSNVRAGVFQVESKLATGSVNFQTLEELNQLSQRVGQLGRFHEGEARALRIRISNARDRLSELLKGKTIHTTTARPATVLPDFSADAEREDQDPF